jgi:hypothetical protein
MNKKNKRREELLKKLVERIEEERIRDERIRDEKIKILTLENKILKEALRFMIRVRYLQSHGIIINKFYILCRLKQYDNLIEQLKNDETPVDN